MENQVDDLTAFIKGMQARLDHDQRHETLKRSPDASTATVQVRAEVKDLQSSIKELWFKVEELTLQQHGSSSTFVPTPVTGAENCNPNALSPPSAAAAAALSVTGSAVTNQRQHQPAKAQQKRKGRRFWSRELHSRFVDAVQRLGGTQVATPKQIRELMEVDGLTDDEVKIHLQNYRIQYTRRRVSSDGGHQYTGRLWSSSSSAFGRGQRMEDVMMN